MNSQNIHYLRSKNLECIRLLGKGAFSEVALITFFIFVYQVILAEHTVHKKLYAIKILNHRKSPQSLVKSEVKILKQLSHPNIIHYYKGYFHENKAYIVMEYAEGGTISSNFPQTDEQKQTLFKHLILAVQYLHQNNIIHCDLKFENILITKLGDYTTIKIIDFGLSFQFESNEDKLQYILSNQRQYGTPNYMAPELFNNAIYSKEIDIWSCGIILYILQFGSHPFIEKPDTFSVIKKKLKQPEFKNLCMEKCELHKFSICELIKKMTKIEPEQRFQIIISFEKFIQINCNINLKASLINTQSQENGTYCF